MNIMKIISDLGYIRRLLFLDKETKRFILHNRKVWRDYSNNRGNSVILLDLFDVGEAHIARSYFVNILAKKHGAQIKSFGRPTRLPRRVLRKVYRSFNVNGHIVTALNKEQSNRRKAILREIVPALESKQDIYNLKVLGIWIGVDIYESYLKEFNMPTLFLDDPKLLKLIKEGIGLVIFWQDFIAKNKVAAVVASHDCYLQFNALCKVAYQANVPVYLPNIRGISLVDGPFANYAHFPNYRSMFNRLSAVEKKQAIELAKRQLERRFNGEVGVDMPYATKSAFQSLDNQKRVLRDTRNIKVLICSHCFYDNPYAFGPMLFLDFYEWLRYLGKISEKTSYDWYLKVHPDPLPGTLDTIRSILSEFPRISIVPHETSHHQLVKEGINFVLTVYGSVGHECPALGVQVINAGYNPHIAYDFSWYPKTLEEYEHYLFNLDKLRKDIDMNQIYEFYYMHYYYVLADDLFLDSYREYLKLVSPAQRVGSGAYKYFFNQLTEGRHRQIIGNLENFIDSGKRSYFSRGPE